MALPFGFSVVFLKKYNDVQIFNVSLPAYTILLSYTRKLYIILFILLHCIIFIAVTAGDDDDLQLLYIFEVIILLTLY